MVVYDLSYSGPSNPFPISPSAISVERISSGLLSRTGLQARGVSGDKGDIDRYGHTRHNFTIFVQSGDEHLTTDLTSGSNIC